MKRKKLSEFRPQTSNANRHTERGIALLDKSIRTDGWIGAVTVAADGETFDGSARLERVADVMAEQEPIVVETDGTRPIIIKRTDIPDAQDKRAKRLAVAANAIASADWNPDGDLLAALSAEDDYIAQLVKNDDRAAKAMLEAERNAGGGQDAEPQIDRAAELNKKWQVKTGDLWRIGAHRLLCGDSTKREDVERVMQGEKANLIATDPPYGVSVGKIRQQMRTVGHGGGIVYDDIENDNLSTDELKNLLITSFGNALAYCVPNVAVYSWMPPMWTSNAFFEAYTQLGLLIHRRIEWVKDSLVLGRGDYHWKHESCLYGWPKGKRPPFYGERNQTTIWEVSRSSLHIHPTEKPIELYEIPIRNHTAIGECVVDIFAGIGSCAVACENISRKAMLIELEANYCAVILQRMSDAFPGIEIERVA